MPELIVSLQDGNSEAILGKVKLTFISCPREQEVLHRLSRLFDVQPLGGQLKRYVEPETARQNADALIQLFRGQNAEITILVERRPTAPPTSPTPRPSSEPYQKIVEAVRTALNETADEPRIGAFELDPELFSAAIRDLSNRANNFSKILEQIRLALSNVEPSLAEKLVLPKGADNLEQYIRDIKEKLRACEHDKNSYYSELKELQSKHTLVEKEKRRLEEQLKELSVHQPADFDGREYSSASPRDERGAI